jgi:hypothetical protein
MEECKICPFCGSLGIYYTCISSNSNCSSTGLWHCYTCGAGWVVVSPELKQEGEN